MDDKDAVECEWGSGSEDAGEKDCCKDLGLSLALLFSFVPFVLLVRALVHIFIVVPSPLHTMSMGLIIREWLKVEKCACVVSEGHGRVNPRSIIIVIWMHDTEKNQSTNASLRLCTAPYQFHPRPVFQN